MLHERSDETSSENLQTGSDGSPTFHQLTQGDPLMLLALEEAMRLLASIPSRSLPGDLRPLHRGALLRLAYFLTHCPISAQTRSELSTLMRALKLDYERNPQRAQHLV